MSEKRRQGTRTQKLYSYLLLAHSRNDGDQEVLAFVKVGLNLGAEFTLRDLNIIFGGTILGHEVEETVVDVDLEKEQVRSSVGRVAERTYKLEFVTLDVRDIHVVGGRTDIFLWAATKTNEIWRNRVSCAPDIPFFCQ